ncbi:MAG: hypothetical protein PQJ60_06320 [Spirochaetales bacterium]|nr:hypothetical protein [Spirochaetales bacterium]
MADRIVRDLAGLLDISVKSFESSLSAGSDSVFVHVGSGRQYDGALEAATEGDSVFIQAATAKDIPMVPPVSGALRFVHAPNLDLNIVKFFRLLSMAGDLFKGEAVSLVESHQKAKSSVPGTAFKMGDYLDFPRSEIVSVRDRETQKGMGSVSLDQHAYHRIQIGEGDSQVLLETKIEGLDSYVRGLARIIEASFSLDRKNYEVEELFELNLL